MRVHNCAIRLILSPFDCVNCFQKKLKFIFFAITTAGVVLHGGPKKSPRAPSIEQIIFFFRSFEISYNIQSINSKDIQSIQNMHV